MRSELERILPRFVEYLLDIRGYSVHTATTYSIAIKQFILSIKKDQEDCEIIDISEFRYLISMQNKKTISKKLSALRSFIRFANTHASKNYSLKSDTPIKVPKTLPKPIEKRYLKEVLDSTFGAERLMILMLYALGLRISELEGVKLTDIDGEYIRVTGKGSKERTIPMVPELIKEIESFVANAKPSIYLFEKGSLAMSSSSMRYMIKKAFARHGIKATPHQLRHSFATDMLENGARIADVSELLGHSSMATTQIYTKLSSNAKLQAYMNAHPMANEEMTDA